MVNILQCTGQPPTAQSDLAEMSVGGVEEPLHTVGQRGRKTRQANPSLTESAHDLCQLKELQNLVRPSSFCF